MRLHHITPLSERTQRAAHNAGRYAVAHDCSAPPQIDLRPRFLHGPKPVTIQAFVSELAVQAF